ncbi:hypothetical protein L6R52_04885 [Myxococcota bacterium]|nr:hypothetical protein [Myxococcota bacterium]
MGTGLGSSIALEAYFDEGDARFLAEVLRSTNAKALGALAPRWYRDPRPELRRMLLEYVDDGLERPHHQPLVKRLYKLAEQAKDHEALAHFLVAFDHLARRQLKTRTRWDWQTREQTTTEHVIKDPKIPRGRAPTANLPPVNGRAPEPPTIEIRRWGQVRKKKLEHLSTFTYDTRRYLQRRAWRYFRELGKKSPAVYRDVINTALQLYRDENLADTFGLLDSWGLVHALYHHSPVLAQDRIGWVVAEGRALSELAPAPIFPELWAESPAPAMELLVRAQARTVRLFAIAILTKHHLAKLAGTELQDLRRLLASPHEEVQVFAADLLKGARGAEKVPITEWMRLFRASSAIVLPVLADLFERAVLPERVGTDECLELACARAAPVAWLGFAWLRARPVTSGPELNRLLGLARAEADSVRADAISWLVGVAKGSPFTTPAFARELVDARYLDVRRAALAWIFGDERWSRDPSLWAAMSETPYDDVRAAFVAHLEQVVAAGVSVGDDALVRVWASVLLAVHRGSRAKLRAVKQVADHVVADPTRADALLPLLSVSLRSLRMTEKRNALAALGRAAYFGQELRAAITRHLPGLVLFPEALTVEARVARARRDRGALEQGGAP